YRGHILPHIDLLKRRSVDRGHWWALFRPRQRQDDPKIVSTYYGDCGSFAFDERGEFVVVQGYSWFPKVTKRGKGAGRKFDTDIGYAYVAILNSPVFFKALSAK